MLTDDFWHQQTEYKITYVHEVKSPRASTAGTTLNVGGQTVATLWGGTNYKSSLGRIPVYLTAVFFETGAMLTPTKSQNGTNCGSRGSFQSYLTHS